MIYRDLLETDEYWSENLSNLYWAIKNNKISKKNFIEMILKDKNELIKQF